MGKEWTDEEVAEEIKNAVAIVREDRFEAFVRSRTGQTNDNPPSGNGQSDNGGNGGGNDNPPPKKGRSLWWGESE